MQKNWYNMKERSAGAFRLYILWIIYKFFGKNFLKLITFFVALISFLFAKEIRNYSKKYFSIISSFSKKNISPNFINLFKHYLSYAYSLVDKIEIFSGNFNYKKIIFEDNNEKEKLFNDFAAKKGIFFICNHLGNVDVMRAFLSSDFKYSNINVNVFLQKNQTKIFNEFIEKISIKTTLTTYPVEEISIETAIELKDKIEKGEIAFMAGDRVSKQNTSKVFHTKLFDKNIQLPIGTFKFASLMECPIYFVSCVKVQNDCYKVILEKFDFVNNQKKIYLNELQQKFIHFLEKNTVNYPFQFYHFYDMFD